MDDASADEGCEEHKAAGDASPSRADVDVVVAACRDQLRPVGSWTIPGGYPHSLGMAMLDAIWATGERYAITRGVLARYASSRRSQRADPFHDNVSDLLAEYERHGGVDGFIEEVGTRNRVSTQPGAELKGVVVYQAALAFSELGVDTAQRFIEAQGTPLGEALATR